MQKNNQRHEHAITRLLALLMLIATFVLDKIMQKIQPPLSDYWYAALFGVAVFGRGVKDIFEVFKK